MMAPSAAGEIRRAFLAECGDAFFIIRGAAELALQVALVIELRLQRDLPALAHRELDRGEAPGRPARQTRDELVGLAFELVVVDRAPDQAPAFRLFRAERLAGQCQAQGARLPREPRQ